MLRRGARVASRWTAAPPALSAPRITGRGRASAAAEVDLAKDLAAQLERVSANPKDFREAMRSLPPDARERLIGEYMRNPEDVQTFVSHLDIQEVRSLGIAAMSRHFRTDFQKEFEAIDLDSSGTVSRQEFRRYLAKVLPAHHAADGSRPTNRQLILFGLNSAIPFVVFGCLDNSIMILGGDVVDELIGSWVQLSTLACAALANTFADVLGISIGNSVEALTRRLGLPEANLTPAQVELPLVRRIGIAAGSFGILAGCIIGMTPLMFMDQDRKAAKQAFASVDSSGSGVLDLPHLQRVLARLGVFDVDQEQLSAAVKELSIARDGTITSQEFLDHVTKLKLRFKSE